MGKNLQPYLLIRPLEERDIDTVCGIVNENWKNAYSGYVNPLLLSSDGCAARTRRLKTDFAARRLSEYVWKEENRVSAMLSFGDTAGAFEIWRIYVASQFQGKGIRKMLMDFAEKKAEEQGYKEIVIWAFKNNHHAVSFYKKRGYNIDKEEYLSEPYFSMGIRLKKNIG